MAEKQLADVLSALSDLLSELVDGTPGTGGYILNPLDEGLLAPLNRINAQEASTVTSGAATTIAAHVDHMRYGISLFNRWARGEKDPFSSANWGQSWKRATVDAAAWHALRDELASELHTWALAIKEPRPMNDVALKGVLASVIHLAYHLGAIRQMNEDLRGPKEAH